jgi:uncharacterized membrane protein YkoI
LEEDVILFGSTRSILFVVLTVVLVGLGTPVVAQEEPYAPVIDPANFVEGIDHPYFSLTPGTTWVYEGETELGLERIEVSVLPTTKLILGVVCTVVRDTVWLDGLLVEDTYDWYAQDRDGSVWYMGEETREYEDGVVVSTAGAWEAGVDGAQPGIIMEAEPQIGDSYRQEYYAGEAEDMAAVISLSDSASVSFGDFDHLVVTEEWTPLEPGVAEHKYYAQGVGLVLEVVVEGGSGQVELVDVLTRDPHMDDDTDDGDESEVSPAGTPVISVGDALQAAAADIGSDAAHEIELEYEGGVWVYGVEIGSGEVTVDAFTGDVLSVEDEGD